MIAGAAITAARCLCTRERQTGRVSPCPHNIYGLYTRLICSALYRLYAESAVEIMVKIVKIEQRAVQNQRQLGNVARVDD